MGWLIRDLYRGAWRDVLRNYGWFLAGFAGIVAVWLFVEWVVILSPLAGNRAAWWVMHVAYFFLTAMPEAALVRLADNIAAGRLPRWRILPNVATVVRYTMLKFIVLPVFIIGLLLLIVPGLYVGARLLFSGFYVVVESRPVVGSLRFSLMMGQGRIGELMVLVLSLVLLNLLGLALMGVGLLITLPLSYVVVARAYRQADRAFGIRTSSGISCGS